MGTNPKEEINIEEMSYKIHIQPLFNANCVNCHGNNGNLSLTTYNNLMKGGNSGKSIIANNSTGSLLINRLSGEGPGQRMPPEPASQLDDMKIEEYLEKTGFAFMQVCLVKKYRSRFL